ncbi:hypothetical protein OF377_02170 [Ureaplasma sp. ES3154-GEN]|uniref:hypothetical protein n=1 Tax=Ureaplasma sp. ES3154-GEN TaxID=2984844 RepID=UPI0021E8C212|nr:hypothetical protein [Ureaplasma sp. ES3154-GEN]MCV3743675.1 hypothetical protein [Ureaplasma sp. ES3154-GEN]
MSYYAKLPFRFTDHALSRIKTRHPKYSKTPTIDIIISGEINTKLSRVRPSTHHEHPDHLIFQDPSDPKHYYLTKRVENHYLVITYAQHNHRKKGIYGRLFNE